MSENLDAHKTLFDLISHIVCDKPNGFAVEDCLSEINKHLCQKYGKCRIYEKTEEQLKYISHPLSEKTFLNACPGSGKTEVVGLKAASEIKQWNSKYSGIAFLTFTNNAARIIKDRVIQFTGSDNIGYPHFIGTIDSWLHRYLAHPFAHRITGYNGHNGNCSIRLVENSSKAAFLNNFQTRYKINNTGEIKANEFFYDIDNNSFFFWSGNNTLDKLRNEWQLDDWQIKELEETKEIFLKAGFGTYQDFEYLCFKLLGTPAISSKISSRFPHIIIDECQDLSGTQLKIIDKLIQAGVSFHFVGDLNQSIYSFKGVNPENIQSFLDEKHFSSPNLTDNFRSSQPIADLCSYLVNQPGITGKQNYDANIPACVYFSFDNDSDMPNLPKRFADYIEMNPMDIKESALLARNYNIIGKIRAHSNPRDKHISYFPVFALNTWRVPFRSLEQTKEAILLMGKFMAERYYSSIPSNSRKYYCPENISSPIRWRQFIACVLIHCCYHEELVNFQQPWREWGIHFRQEFDQILHNAINEFDTISLPDDFRDDRRRYRVPYGQAKNSVVDCLPSTTTKANGVIRITTFHKIKGETLDASMVVSSRTGQGRGGGYWLHWLEDPTSEFARLAYVASSRPRHLIAWAIPLHSLIPENLEKLKELGFTEAIES